MTPGLVSKDRRSGDAILMLGLVLALAWLIPTASSVHESFTIPSQQMSRDSREQSIGSPPASQIWERAVVCAADCRLAAGALAGQ